jgi:hypothetical protein
MKYPETIKMNYPVMRSMDVFLSSQHNPTGAVIRTFERRSISNAYDLTTANHGGFIASWNGQYFAAEMSPRFEINSLEKYTTRKNQIIELWRWNGFDGEVIRRKAEDDLSECLRRAMEVKYDWRGAIASCPLGRNPLFRKIFPFIRDYPQSKFCTDLVFNVLKKYGFVDYPKIWDSTAPCPWQLQCHFKLRSDFTRINFTV